MTDRRERQASAEAAATASTAAAAAAEVVRVASAAAAQVLEVAGLAAQQRQSVITLDLQYIKDDLKEIKARLDEKFVTKDVFDPIRNLVYGLVAIILTGVVGAVITLVLRK